MTELQAPKTKADYADLLQDLNHLSRDLLLARIGRATAFATEPDRSIAHLAPAQTGPSGLEY